MKKSKKKKAPLKKKIAAKPNPAAAKLAEPTKLEPCQNVICWGVCKRTHSSEQEALTRAYYAAYDILNKKKNTQSLVTNEEVNAVLKSTKPLMVVDPVFPGISKFHNELLQFRGETKKSVNDFLTIIHSFIQDITKFVKIVKFDNMRLVRKRTDEVMFVFPNTVTNVLPNKCNAKDGIARAKEDVASIGISKGGIFAHANDGLYATGVIAPPVVRNAWNVDKSKKTAPSSSPPGFENSQSGQWGNKGYFNFDYLTRWYMATLLL